VEKEIGFLVTIKKKRVTPLFDIQWYIRRFKSISPTQKKTNKGKENKVVMMERIQSSL